MCVGHVLGHANDKNIRTRFARAYVVMRWPLSVCGLRNVRGRHCLLKWKKINSAKHGFRVKSSRRQGEANSMSSSFGYIFFFLQINRRGTARARVT